MSTPWLVPCAHLQAASYSSEYISTCSHDLVHACTVQAIYGELLAGPKALARPQAGGAVTASTPEGLAHLAASFSHMNQKYVQVRGVMFVAVHSRCVLACTLACICARMCTNMQAPAAAARLVS